jgi:hypothetical protein
VILLEFLLWQPKLIAAVLWTSHLNLWYTTAFKGLLLISLALALNHRVFLAPLEVVLIQIQSRLGWKRQSSTLVVKKQEIDISQKQEIKISRHYYQLIGACYLHGMMNGEAIRVQNEHNIKAESFEIR